MVLAYNEATGEIGYYPITATWLHNDTEIVFLTIDGEVIETTPEHPFYTDEGEWVAVGLLEIGDKIQTADGGYGVVNKIETLLLVQPMYNLTVDEAHTFFVGEGEWLVHNRCQGHHIIPKTFRTHSLVRLASRDGWNINHFMIDLPDNQEEANLLGLPYHNGSHPDYNDYVEGRLDALYDLAVEEKWTPAQAAAALNALAYELRLYIELTETFH